MAYATLQDLIDRFGADEIAQISDTTGGGVLDAARVAKALDDTAARIDGYLGSRYQLPLTTVPPILKELACDIARYLLTRLPTEEMRDRQRDALAWLDKVAKGDYGLGIDGSGTAPAPSGGAVGFSGGGRVFTADSLRDYLDPAQRGGGIR